MVLAAGATRRSRAPTWPSDGSSTIPSAAITRRRTFDPDIFTLYRAYEPVLDTWKDLYEKWLAARLVYDREMKIAQAQAAQQMMGASLFFAMNLLADAPARDVVDSLRVAAQVQAVQRAKLTAKQQEAQKQFDKARGEAVDAFRPRYDEVYKKNYRLFTEGTNDLCSRHDWKVTEFAHGKQLTTTTDSEPPRNPFRLFKTAREVLKNKDAAREELLEQAAACQRAVEMIPAGKLRGGPDNYDIFRSTFLAAAGIMANRAALKDLGATGFSSALTNPPKAGPVALKIWDRYLRSEGALNDKIIYQFIQACGCAGKPALAYQLIVANGFQPDRRRRPVVNDTFSRDPAFWYDSARIASLVGEPGVAVQCLQQAVRLGFRDFEAAKVDPDLKLVREHPATNKQFQAALR
jgi:phosphoglycolate phosphatase-like HAD superfamily hydrolase